MFRIFCQIVATTGRHHAIMTQKKAAEWGAPNWLRDSPANVLKPKGMSRGDFYELHYKVDPKFNHANLPGGGGWTASQIPGLGEKLTGVRQAIQGTPTAVKSTVGGAATAGAVAYTQSNKPPPPPPKQNQ